MAAEARVKALVLVHHGPQLDDAGPKKAALAEASSNFDGEVIFGDKA